MNATRVSLMLSALLFGSLAVAGSEAVFEKKFAGLSGWRTDNYDNRLTISEREIDGEHCEEICLKRKDCDTSFVLRGDCFPVKAGSGFRLVVRVRGTFQMENACGQWGRGGTYIGWRDAHGNRLVSEHHFGFKVEDGRWQDVTTEGLVPVGAAEAFVVIAADVPNFKENERLLLSRVSFHEVPADSVSVPVVPKPEPLETELDPSIEPIERNVVTLRDDGMTLIDGKPFFPIGIYSVHRCPANSNDLKRAFRQLKDAGFNLVHTYDWKRNDAYAEYLDLAERYGMKLLNNPAVPFPDNVLDERKRPNMLAWYLADDASRYTTPEKLRKFSLDVKKYDNAHLTAQADSLGDAYKTRYADFIGSTDVFLPEIYTACGSQPIGHEVLFVDYQVRALFRELAEAGNPVKGIWPILQQFRGWGGWSRFPTAEEIRAMAYIAIVGGAQGLMWYTYAASQTGSGKLGAAEDQARWNDLAKVTRELSEIQDDLATRSVKRTVPLKILDGPEKDGFENASVHCLMKHGVSGKLLIAVNAALKPVKARIGIRGCRKVQVLFEERTLSAVDGLVDDFAPNGVHVYRLDR